MFCTKWDMTTLVTMTTVRSGARAAASVVDSLSGMEKVSLRNVMLMLFLLVQQHF